MDFRNAAPMRCLRNCGKGKTNGLGRLTRRATPGKRPVADVLIEALCSALPGITQNEALLDGSGRGAVTGIRGQGGGGDKHALLSLKGPLGVL